MTTEVNLDELKEIKNFGDGSPGDGVVLGMKLLLQSMENIIVVNSTGSYTNFAKNLEIPMVHAGLNAAAVARGIARSLDEKSNTQVVVFAGDGATAINLGALISSNENIIYVCANDNGYSSIDYRLNRSFTKELAGNSSYLATACVSHPEDYIKKLKKAREKSGFKFIDLLCPSPALWGYEPSNTIEVGRVAVETGLWPLYEVERGIPNLTKRPRLEPVENFNHVQSKFQLQKDEIEKIQRRVNRQWKLLTDGRLF